MRNGIICLSALLITGVLGCETASLSPKVVMCEFPETKTTQAPDWVCDKPVEGLELQGVGSHRKTKAGVAFQTTQAESRARESIARQMQVRVKNLVKNYTETTGVGDVETVDTVSSDVSKNVASETLVGTKRYGRVVNKKSGTMYVLVGLDKNSFKATSRQAILSSMNNKRAMWQRALGEKAHKELEEEVEKMIQQLEN